MAQSANKKEYVYDTSKSSPEVSTAIENGVASEGSFPKLVNVLLYKCWAYEGDERAAKVRDAVEYLADKTIAIGGNDDAENVFSKMLDKMQEDSGYASMPEALRPKIPVMKVDEKTLTQMRDEIIDTISKVINKKVTAATGNNHELELTNANESIRTNKQITDRLNELMRVVNQYDATGETTLNILSTIKKAAIDIGGKAELEIARNNKIVNAERDRRDAERKRLADLEAEAKRQAAEAEQAAREAREAAQRAEIERKLAEKRKQALEESEKRREEAEKRAAELAEETKRRAAIAQPVITLDEQSNKNTIETSSTPHLERSVTKKRKPMSFTDAFAAIDSPYEKMTGGFPALKKNNENKLDASSMLDALANASLDGTLDNASKQDGNASNTNSRTLTDDDFDSIDVDALVDDLGDIEDIDEPINDDICMEPAINPGAKVGGKHQPMSFTAMFSKIGSSCSDSSNASDDTIIQPPEQRHRPASDHSRQSFFSNDDSTINDAEQNQSKKKIAAPDNAMDFDDDTLAGLSSLLDM